MVNIPNILIFDSGIGGISVYNEIKQKIPNANYIYYFDNEAFPYGDKTSAFIVERVNQAIRCITLQYQIDIVVIACNTASTICLPSLRENFQIPIVGVVPAVKPATLITKNRCIGLLATKATVQREYTHNLINQFAGDYQVLLLGLSELAIIAEKKLQGHCVDMQELEKLMQPWLSLSIIPDTIVLGCTHYPFIKDELQQLFPNSQFIDSGYAIANRVYNLLQQNFSLSDNTEYLPEIRKHLVCSTLLDKQVTKIVENLRKYNFDKYQEIKVLVG